MLSSAKPLVLCLGLAYLSGSPCFDAVRPDALDMPLQGFYQEMTAFAAGWFRTAGLISREDVIAATDRTTTGLFFARLMGDVGRDLKDAI